MEGFWKYVPGKLERNAGVDGKYNSIIFLTSAPPPQLKTQILNLTALAVNSEWQYDETEVILQHAV